MVDLTKFNWLWCWTSTKSIRINIQIQQSLINVPLITSMSINEFSFNCLHEGIELRIVAATVKLSD